MPKIHRIILATIFLSCASLQAALAGPPEDALVIERNDSGYVLSVPVSKLQLAIPDNKLVDVTDKMRRSEKDRRYFYFTDDARGLILSGWFESSSEYRGLLKFWQGEKAGWAAKQLPEPKNLAVEQINAWQVIFYDMDIGSGADFLNLRAELIEAGTWVDLHISLGKAATPPSRDQLVEILKSIEVVERSK